MITQHPQIKGGQPHIKGTRVTVSEILLSIGRGLSVAEIIKRCKAAGVPISKKDISEALYFASSKFEKSL